jgi:hypothetical protein
MDHILRISLRLRVAVSLAGSAACLATLLIHGHAQAVAGSELTQGASVDGFKHVEVASVSDAIEQLLHQNTCRIRCGRSFQLDSRERH